MRRRIFSSAALSPAASARFSCTPSQASSGLRQPCAEAMSIAARNAFRGYFSRLELHAGGNQARQRRIGSGPFRAAGKKFIVGEFFGTRVGAPRRETRAVVEFQAGRARGAAHQFRARDQVAAPAGGNFILQPGKLDVGRFRIADQVILLESIHGRDCIQLPVRRRRPAAAGREQQQE